MFRLLASRANVSAAGVLPFFDTKLFDYDIPSDLIEVSRENETGFDRLREMIFPREGMPSAEVAYIFKSTVASYFMGAIYGGITSSRRTLHTFLEHNEATKFHSAQEAKKKLSDKMLLNFISNGHKWAWRAAVFTTVYMTATTAIQVYRGKSSIVEYVGGGATAGFVYKFFHGPRESLVGAAVGGTLGLVLGGASLLFLWVAGVNMEKIRADNFARVRHDNEKEAKKWQIRRDTILGNMQGRYEKMKAESEEKIDTDIGELAPKTAKTESIETNKTNAN